MEEFNQVQQEQHVGEIARRRGDGKDVSGRNNDATGTADESEEVIDRSGIYALCVLNAHRSGSQYDSRDRVFLSFHGGHGHAPATVGIGARYRRRARPLDGQARHLMPTVMPLPAGFRTTLIRARAAHPRRGPTAPASRKAGRPLRHVRPRRRWGHPSPRIAVISPNRHRPPA